jgi:hypothetical protein
MIIIDTLHFKLNEVLTSPESHTFVVWVLFSSLIGLYSGEAMTPTTRQSHSRQRQRRMLWIRAVFPVIQFIWISYSLPIAYKVIPSPFFPPPYFMQKFLVDTAELRRKQHNIFVVVMLSLFGSFWCGVLTMKCIVLIGRIFVNDDHDVDATTAYNNESSSNQNTTVSAAAKTIISRASDMKTD